MTKSRIDLFATPDRACMTSTSRSVLYWILGSAIGIACALAPMASALDASGYVPVGVDSFYHARRILDAAADLASLMQFDPAIHAPAGSLLTWPWAYDWLMALLVRVGVTIVPGVAPIEILDYLPVLAVPLAIALMLKLAQLLELSPPFQLMAVLLAALSPLNQWLFRIGMIDHHWTEYAFVLGTICASLAWLRNPSSLRHACVAAFVLGISPAFQNGLFILQLPLVIALLALRFSDHRLPRDAAISFAATMVITSLLVATPSLAFRQGHFSYYYLSWFHVYVAACTAFAVIASARVPLGRKYDLALLATCAIAALPLASQVWLGARYLRADLEHTYRIAEVQTLLEQLSGDGPFKVATYYSWLFVLVPVIWAGSVYYVAAVRRSPVFTQLCATSIVGIAMLAAKFRLANFGSFAMIVAPLLFIDRRWPVGNERRRLVLGATAALAFAAYLPCLAQLFGARQWLAMSPDYALTHEIYPAMAAACNQHPGTVLASNNDGHYIRYHTRCAVIADNFMLTPDDAASLDTMERFMSMTPEELLRADPVVDYVFARSNLIVGLNDRGTPSVTNEESQKAMNAPLVNRLVFGDTATLDAHFRLIAELRWPPPNDRPYARLFQIVRDPR